MKKPKCSHTLKFALKLTLLISQALAMTSLGIWGCYAPSIWIAIFVPLWIASCVPLILVFPSIPSIYRDSIRVAAVVYDGKKIHFKNGLTATLHKFGDENEPLPTQYELKHIGFHSMLPEDLQGCPCLKFAFSQSTVKLIFPFKGDGTYPFPFKGEDIYPVVRALFETGVTIALADALLVLVNDQIYFLPQGKSATVVRNALEAGVSPNIYALISAGDETS